MIPSRFYIWFFRISLLVTCIFILPTSSLADSFLGGSLQASPFPFPIFEFPVTATAGPVSQGPLSVGPVSIHYSYTSAGTLMWATSSGTVNFGDIAGQSDLGGAFGGHAYSNFTGTWQDSITVTSSSLPAGTPVSLEFILGSTGYINNWGQYPYGVGVGSLNFSSSFSAGDQQTSFSTPLSAGSFVDSEDLILATWVGQTLLVTGHSEMSASSWAQAYGFQSLSGWDANFIINDLTSGTGYYSATDTSYGSGWAAQPVPEPSSLALLGASLLLVPLLRRMVH